MRRIAVRIKGASGPMTSVPTSAPPTPTQEPAHEGLIVFYSERDGNAEIYVMNPDGSSQRRLTENDSDEFTPAWSPNGTQIAFQSDRDDPNPVRCFPDCIWKIYLMNADGSDTRRLVDTGLDDYFPDWSPDGKQIVFFAANWPTIQQDIYVVNADGSDLRRLTDTPRVVDENPQWSPDGSKIVFQTDRDGNFEIYMMDPDGSNQQNVTRNPGRD